MGKYTKAQSEAFAKMRLEGCAACGSMYQTEIHHIKTRGSGGSNHESNCIPLCSGCHTQEPYAWHRGRWKLINKFPHLLKRFREKGWEIYGDKFLPPADAMHRPIERKK